MLLDALTRLEERFGEVYVPVWVSASARSSPPWAQPVAWGAGFEAREGKMDLMTSLLRAEPRGPEAEPYRSAGTRRRKPAAEHHAASVAAWLDAHRHQIIECGRHNGLARLTVKACAERYRRAVVRWVDSLDLRENDKHSLRLSFAVCGACPVGATVRSCTGWSALLRKAVAHLAGTELKPGGPAAGPPPCSP